MAERTTQPPTGHVSDDPFGVLEIGPLGFLFQVSFLLVNRDVDQTDTGQQCWSVGYMDKITVQHGIPQKLASRKIGNKIYDVKGSLNAAYGSRVSGLIYGSETLVVNMRTRGRIGRRWTIGSLPRFRSTILRDRFTDEHSGCHQSNAAPLDPG